MISKLPRWVWMGAWLLAFIAGTINVVGFLGFEHEAITHLTGSTSLLSIGLASADFTRAFHYAAIIGAFVLGCTISGFVVQDSSLKLGRRYGIALVLASALLFVAVPLLQHGSSVGLYAAACACGLQNAMVSTYSGAVVRTTHLSGMFTDLGIFIGHFARGLTVDRRRLSLCVTVISGFLCGGVAGAAVFELLGYASLFVPATLTAALAVAYAIRRTRFAASA